jgi:Matrixin/Carboxypeptidase regulatory-like domain
VTLGVTWYDTTTDEADTALNTRFPWTTTTGGSGYDIETVFLHEIGHTLGLGHSSVSGAVMEATYAAVRRTLHQDDQRGITYLYPDSSGDIGVVSGIVTSSVDDAPISGAKISINNLPIVATSSPDGRYTLSGVPDIGTYSVTATAKGYTSKTNGGVDVPATVSFALTPGGGGACVPKGPSGNNCP